MKSNNHFDIIGIVTYVTNHLDTIPFLSLIEKS